MLCFQVLTILGVATLFAEIGAKDLCDKNRDCRRVLTCVDRRQCQTAYGDSPLDISLYGLYQPCQDYGEVRCLDPLQIEESSLEDATSLALSESSSDLPRESTTESHIEKQSELLLASMNEANQLSSQQSTGNQIPIKLPGHEHITHEDNIGDSTTDNQVSTSSNEVDTDNEVLSTVSYTSHVANPAVLGQGEAVSGTGAHDTENPIVSGDIEDVSGTGFHDAENPISSGQVEVVSGTGSHDAESPIVLEEVGATTGNGSQQHQADILEELQEEEPVIIVDLSDETIEEVQTGKPDVSTEGAPSQPQPVGLQIPTLAFVPVIVNGIQVYILASVNEQHPSNQPLLPAGSVPLHPPAVPINGVPIAGPVYPPLYPQAPSGWKPGKITSLKEKVKTVLKRKKNVLKSLIRDKLKYIRSKTFFKLDH